MNSPAGMPPFTSLSWRGGFNPVFLLCCGLIVVINWFVPAQWIEGSARAMAYAELVRENLLHISRYADIWAHARSTLFPKAALFSHAVTWTLVILVIVYDFLLVAFNSRAWTLYWIGSVWAPAPPKRRATIAASGLVVLAVSWVITMMPGSMDHTASADLHSRVVLGFLSACVFILWHMVALTYEVMLFALFIHIRDKDLS